MNCKDASHLISAAQDRSLSWRERLGLRWHLFLCDACTRFRQHVQFLHRLALQARAALAEHSSLALSPPARERINRAIDENQP